MILKAMVGVLSAFATTFAFTSAEATVATSVAKTMPELTTQDKENAAVAAAQQWLMLVDGGNFDGSWVSAASAFQSKVSQEKWKEAIRSTRTPLGKVISRAVKSKTYTKSVPGAPDGEYVILQFETIFEKKKSSLETITPMLDKDGTWRVSGYFLK